MYSKKNWFAGASSMWYLVIPCSDPLDPLPPTTAEMSYGSHPNDPRCSFPGYFMPFLVITLFCILVGGTQLIKNLPR